jgi:hypothetical protein
MFKKSHFIGASALVSVSAFATGEAITPQNSMQCSTGELQSYIANYERGLEVAIASEPTTSFSQFRKQDIARRVNDPNEDREKTLCSVIMDPSFDVNKLTPDFSKLTDAYNNLKLLMAAESGAGLNFSMITSEAISAAMAQLKEKAKESACDIARSSTSKIDAIANDLYKTGVAKGQQMILSDERVEDLGVTNFNKPVWQQMAGEQVDEQLGAFADQAKWYEDGWTIEDATGDVIGTVTEDGKDEWIGGLEAEDSNLAELPF